MKQVIKQKRNKADLIACIACGLLKLAYLYNTSKRFAIFICNSQVHKKEHNHIRLLSCVIKHLTTSEKLEHFK